MGGNEFKKFWDNTSDALYEVGKTHEILNAFNQAINGLYFIGSEGKYIFDVLNTSAPAAEEYKKITNSIGIELIEISYKLEAMRSILFGDCINWSFICDRLDRIGKEEKEIKNTSKF